jgi:hypothetical protein
MFLLSNPGAEIIARHPDYGTLRGVASTEEDGTRLLFRKDVTRITQVFVNLMTGGSSCGTGPKGTSIVF